MVWAMGVAAGMQAALGLYGLTADPLGGVFSTGFAGIWLLGAALFAMAARQQRAS
jgi:hypothetical protein